MKRILRNLAIALLILTITVLAWLTDPTEHQNCEDLNDDVAAVVIGPAGAFERKPTVLSPATTS